MNVKLKNIYDDYFSDYDSKCNQLINNYIQIGNKKTMKALDLGVGDGVNAIYLAKNGYEVFGNDISKVAIKKAEKKFIKNSLHGHFEVKDVRDVEIFESSYDFILCSMVAHYLEKNEVVILVNKIKKGLSPNGIVFFSILSTDDPQYKKNSQNMLSKYIKTFMSKKEVLKLFDGLSLMLLQDSMMTACNVPSSIYYDEGNNIMGDIVYIGRKSG